MYWSAGAKDALDGRTRVQQAGRRHPGRRAAVQPAADAAQRPGRCPAWSARPFVVAHASRRDASVFDNGLAPGAHRLDPRRRAGRADPDPAHRPGSPGCRSRPAIDNLILAGPRGPRRRWRTWSPARERGLLLTCLWYIREVDPQTLLLTGLTRDGVYLVENGEVSGAVNNFRFNESPVGMLGRLAEVGAAGPPRCRASGATTSPGARCPRSGWRTSTCPRSARPAERPAVARSPPGSGRRARSWPLSARSQPRGGRPGRVSCPRGGNPPSGRPGNGPPRRR